MLSTGLTKALLKGLLQRSNEVHQALVHIAVFPTYCLLTFSALSYNSPTDLYNDYQP